MYKIMPQKQKKCIFTFAFKIYVEHENIGTV